MPLSIRIRAKTQDIEKGSMSMPPTMATVIWACCADRLKPNEHLFVSREKIVEVGTCDVSAKKINIEAITPH